MEELIYGIYAMGIMIVIIITTHVYIKIKEEDNEDD